MSVTRVSEMLRARMSGTVRAHEPMWRHTTYRIGGPAMFYVVPDTLGDLSRTLETFEDEAIEWTVLGKGSNVLVSDEGYDGAIIVLGRDFRRHVLDDDRLKAGAGCVLGQLVQDAFSRGLAGLEFAVGIPGTFGGALVMNAGSRDTWMGPSVETVAVYVPGEGLAGLRGSEISWGYRTSDLPSRGVVVEAVLRLEVGDAEVIRRRMEGSLQRRRRSQPMGAACAGSVFVNPVGDSAGRLIEAAGLKGARCGGAVVSTVHANFIVNEGGARADDVVGLIRQIRHAVKDKYGIELAPEIRFLGPFEDA